MVIPLSVLDLVPILPGQTAGAAIEVSVALAREAEASGYERVWYAEHHNMESIASSATSVLVAHVAAHTERIRLGAGGVMLPNHVPLVVAEQFGTLAALHPGRIELGLGRAPGTDPVTMRALRRDFHAADTFPDDVLELQGYLRGESLLPGVSAVPGSGTDVPLYILGSSLSGARLAARLGLPYAFASHFAPAALHEAVAAYRSGFTPSRQLDEPRVLAGVNVVCADTAEEARHEAERAMVHTVAVLAGRGGRRLGDEEARALLRSGAAAQLEQMTRHTAVGTPADVRDHLREFARAADADELVVVHRATSVEARLRSVRLTAEAVTGLGV